MEVPDNPQIPKGSTVSHDPDVPEIPDTLDTSNFPKIPVLPDIPGKKCVVVGTTDSGKTSLLLRFAKGYSPTEHERPVRVCENIFQVYEIEGNPTLLVLCDTIGHFMYNKVRSVTYQCADVFIVCFSIGQPESFLQVRDRWKTEIQRLIDYQYVARVPIILVGNKKDLRDDPDTIQYLERMGQKPVTLEEAEAMAEEIDAYAYFESSAKNNEGVEQIFEMVAYSSIHPLKPKKRRCIMQ